MLEFAGHEEAGTTGEFYARHSNGRRPRSWYIVDEDGTYPAKAVWAAATRPRVKTASFNTYDARRGLAAMGFAVLPTEAAAAEYLEGGRRIAEGEMLRRNPLLVARAKAHYGLVCRACGFDARRFPGIGGRAVECHHIEPLSGRKTPRPTRIEELMILCANCHRMIHDGRRTLSLRQLKALLAQADRPAPRPGS